MTAGTTHRTTITPEAASRDDRRVNVLLVDDRSENLLALEAALGSPDLTLVTARSAHEALKQLLDRDFAVVLLDVRMPGMDGYETASLIRSRDRSRDLPIIFLTAIDTTPEHIARGYALGAVDYILKPFSLDALRSKVAVFAELFRRTRQLREQGEELERTNRELRQQIVERRRAEEERNRLSAELLQGQKMQAVGQLAAGVAHEINNPVSYLLSNMNSIERHLEDLDRLIRSLSEGTTRIAAGGEAVRIARDLERQIRKTDADFLLKDFREALRDCREGAVRIRDIVKSLREFSHPDAGELKKADLRTLLQSAIRLCANEVKYKAKLRESYADLPPVVCHPQRIEQIAVNLLVNAAQAIPERGEITVSTALEEDHAVLRIGDNGTGIAPEHLDRLFEPFFTTKPPGKGTGLGLHVAWKIVKAHGGRILVDSKPGRGTEFTVRLPLSGPPRASASASGS